MKRLNPVNGDATLIYCIRCVYCEDLIARFEHIIPMWEIKKSAPDVRPEEID